MVKKGTRSDRAGIKQKDSEPIFKKEDPNTESKEVNVKICEEGTTHEINLVSHKIYINEYNLIDLDTLLRAFVMDKKFVSYWDDVRKLFIYCGEYDKKELKNLVMPYSAIERERELILKLRGERKTLIQMLMNQQKEQVVKEDDSKSKKQRKISEVLEKVALWRRLYTGCHDESGKIVQQSLQNAANKVHISKKTLDDYLLQIRCGKKYGFDFDAHKNDNIGLLRAYVRKHKK